MDYVNNFLSWGMEKANEVYESYAGEETEVSSENTDETKKASEDSPKVDGKKKEKPALQPQESQSEEKTATESEEFSAEFLTKLLENSFNEEEKAVNVTMFLDACSMVPKLFEGLGTALKQGSGNLVEKIAIVRMRQNEAAKELGVNKHDLSLQDLIERDIRNKQTHVGKAKKPATRNIIRLVWFLDFITILFQQLAEYPDKSLRETIQFCWKNSLGPRQKFMINKATTQILKYGPLPAKEKFFDYLELNDISETEQIEKLKEWSKRVDTVATEMWAYLKSKDLMEVN